MVGDVGGTNCRLSLAQSIDGRLRLNGPQRYKCADFSSAEHAIDNYLKSIDWTAPLGAAVIAVAGPVSAGMVKSTNMHWRMSESELRGHGADRVKLINDYTALALAVDHLLEDDVLHIGPGMSGDENDTVAVIGAGTGFGVGALARGIGGPTAIATEGGHVSFAPVDDVEVEILRILTRRYNRVSIERLLSGPGLVNLQQALSEIEGLPLCDVQSEDVVREAEAGDPLSRRALERFCEIYGSVAGDIALMYGARGGVFLGGGIAPAIAPHLQGGGFRRRFEEKGRFQKYLAAIPTRIIINPFGALLGSASLASDLSSGKGPKSGAV
ncbi:MAG: glucokinase [Caulobacteraceae bacterium]